VLRVPQSVWGIWELDVNQTCVSLDLETSGLDPDNDRIIEVGAVKFRGGTVLGTFHTLVNPGCMLPNRVRLLTGITDDELQVAPPFSAVVDELVSFIGDHSIVGQNVQFDLGFLSSHGVIVSNNVYDVYDLATILLPHLDEYSLPALARQFDISYPVQHRALEDAFAAKDIFRALLEYVDKLDLSVIAEINRLTMASDWPWRSLFLELETGKAGGVSLWDRQAWEADCVPEAKGSVGREPLVPEAVLKPLDVDWLAGFLEEGGVVSKALPGFEYRPGQVLMMRHVAGALNEGRHLVVEAGTGTGKSIAYLLPAVLFAAQNNAPVVVSTNTINLQEQLVTKDLPELLKALSSAGEPAGAAAVKVAQLKGRNNYLCLRRWNSWRKTLGLPWEETRFLLRLLVWLSRTSSGDRAELNLAGNETGLWNRVCASEDNCVPERCSYYPGGCFLYRARRQAVGAHLVAVNHALLVSDLARGGGILPDYGHLIVDEAHHLEEEATEQFGYRVGDRDIYSLLEHFGDRGGFLFHLSSYLRTSSLAASRRRDVGREVEELTERAKRARPFAERFVGDVVRLVDFQVGAQGEYERALRFSQEVRRHRLWSEVQSSWEGLDDQLAGVEIGMAELQATLEGLPSRSDSELNNCLAEMASVRQQVSGLRARLSSIVADPAGDSICWARITWQGELYLHSAPLSVGRMLDNVLFSRKDCVVLTSATLSVGGDLSYIKKSLGVEGAQGLIVDAPFDYAKSTLILLPEDIVAPEKPGYQEAVEQALLGVCRATRGCTLALFTSHAALRATYASVQPVLEGEGILVLGQGIDGSPKRVLNTFKANRNALLMGAAALWEGVDIVGEGLSVLVIVRLPFGVPTDPVTAARSELFDDSFNQYLLPQAVLRFKQGFGRLIRSWSDRGVVLILDKRLQTKAYGDAFLQSLPRCTVKTTRLPQVPEEVLGWLGWSVPADSRASHSEQTKTRPQDCW